MIRYQKAVCGPELDALAAPIVAGRGVFLGGGPQGAPGGRGELLILSFGGILPQVLSAVELLSERGVEADVYNLRFAKPLDEDHLCSLVSGYRRVVTVEEGTLAGGVGEAVAGLYLRRGLPGRVLSLGVPDRYISHGQREELLERCGLSAAALADAAEEFCAASPPFRILRTAT